MSGWWRHWADLIARRLAAAWLWSQGTHATTEAATGAAFTSEDQGAGMSGTPIVPPTGGNTSPATPNSHRDPQGAGR
jgi:hypothetical protein